MARNLPVIFVQENNINRDHKEQDYFDTCKSPELFQVVNPNIITSTVAEKTHLDEVYYPDHTKEIVNEQNANRAYKEKIHIDATKPLVVQVIDQNNIKSGVAETTDLDKFYSQLPKEVVIVKEIDLKPSLVTHKGTIHSHENISDNIQNNFENKNLEFFDRYTTTTPISDQAEEEPLNSLVKTELESTPDSHYRCDQTL